MIRNEAELVVVREQLALAESALESLRRRLDGHRNFALYAEGPIDQIAELKAEIAAYERSLKKKSKSNKNNGKRRRRAS